MAEATSITLRAIAAAVADGSGAAQPMGDRRSAVDLQLVVTAVDATLDVFVETSPDGTSGWVEVGSFDQAAGPFRQRRVFAGCGPYVRVRWEGTGSFGVAGSAHTLYADLDDLFSEIPPEALSDLERHVIAKQLLSATTDAEDAIAMTRPMPLTTWPTSLVTRCAQIAKWRCLAARGIDPDSTEDKLVKDAYDEAQAWLDKLAKDRLRPPALQPETSMGARSETAQDAAANATPGGAAPCIPRFTNNWGDFG